MQALIDFIAELVDIPTPKAKLEQKKYENYLWMGHPEQLALE